jgi:8-oxo-dGTP diphosphatase
MVKVQLIVKSIILNRRLGKILLLKRSKFDNTGADTWENSGGNMEPGETPDYAVRREIYEETGILDIIFSGPIYMTYVNAKNPYLIIAYLTETDNEQVILSEAHQDYKWATKDECKSLLRGGIKDDFERHKIFEMDWHL